MPRTIPVGTAIDMPSGTSNGYDLSDFSAIDGSTGRATIIYIIKNNGLTANMRYLYKGTNFQITESGTGEDDIGLTVNRATVSANSTSSGDIMATGVWKAVAFVYDESDTTVGIKIYHSTAGSPVVEASYANQVAGSGATTSSSGTDAQLFYRAGGSNRTLDADVAYFHWIDRVVSLEEINVILATPGLAVANTVVLYHLGAEATGSTATLKDYSGLGNDATAAGAGNLEQLGAPMGWGRRRGGLLVPAPAASGGVAGIADFNFPSLSITGIGDIPIAGSADFALPNLTITGIGDIPIVGLADFALPNLTVTGVGDIPIAGIADFNLPNLTITGIGDGSAHGIADFNLPNLTVTGIGDIPIAGLADFNLPNLAITGIGDIPIAGLADFNLPNLAITGLGNVTTGSPILGDADFSLPSLGVTGVGRVAIAGVSDFGLPIITITGIGDLPIAGIAGVNFPSLLITGIGDLPIVGIADFNLPNLTVPAIGDILVRGVADFNLPNLGLSATGVVGALSTVDGAADFNLPSLWVNTQGGVDIPMVNIFSTSGQTGAETGTAFTLQRKAGAWFINRDVLAQIILGSGTATINIEASLDGGSTFTNIVTAATASAVVTFNLPPIIRVRLSAATAATVNVWLDADLVVTRVDN